MPSILGLWKKKYVTQKDNCYFTYNIWWICSPAEKLIDILSIYTDYKYKKLLTDLRKCW